MKTLLKFVGCPQNSRASFIPYSVTGQLEKQKGTVVKSQLLGVRLLGSYLGLLFKVFVPQFPYIKGISVKCKWQSVCKALSTISGTFLAFSNSGCYCCHYQHDLHHQQHHPSKWDLFNHQGAKWVDWRNCQLKNQPETPTLIVIDFSKWLYDDDDDINWSTTDIYSRPDIELRYKKKVISLSATQPRSDGYQQPQLTVLCPVPVASTMQVLPGLTAWREGSNLPQPEHHYTGANTNSKSNASVNISSDESSNCISLWAHFGAGVVLTAWIPYLSKFHDNSKK